MKSAFLITLFSAIKGLTEVQKAQSALGQLKRTCLKIFEVKSEQISSGETNQCL